MTKRLNLWFMSGQLKPHAQLLLHVHCLNKKDTFYDISVYSTPGVGKNSENTISPEPCMQTKAIS
jgi:hypothetical protein